MAESRDRRAGSGNKEKEAEVADGRIRRTGNEGGRGWNDFFSKDNYRRELRRGELLGFIQMLEFHRWQNTWWRRALRWLLRQPGPKDVPMEMAHRFLERTVKPVLADVERQMEEMANVQATRPDQPESKITGVTES